MTAAISTEPDISLMTVDHVLNYLTPDDHGAHPMGKHGKAGILMVGFTRDRDTYGRPIASGREVRLLRNYGNGLWSAQRCNPSPEFRESVDSLADLDALREWLRGGS